MKRAIFIVSSLVALNCLGQTLPPPSPVAQVIPEPTLPAPTPTLPPPTFANPATQVAIPTTNARTGNLPDLLTNLQSAVTLALPAVSNLTSSIQFIVVGTNGLAELAPDTGTNLPLNLSTNLSAIVTGNVGVGGLMAGTLVTNTAPAHALSRSQIAQLLVLQNDLDRLLPILSSLNGLPIGATNGSTAQ